MGSFLITLLAYVIVTLVNYKLMSLLMRDEIYNDSDRYLVFGMASMPIISNLLVVTFAIIRLQEKYDLKSFFKKTGNIILFIPNKILAFVMYLIEITPPNTQLKKEEEK